MTGSDPETLPTLLNPVPDLGAAVSATGDIVRMMLDFSEASPVPHYAAEMVWTNIYGQLRGRVPLPVPPDLLGVGFSASMRWCNVLSQYRMDHISGDRLQESPGFFFTGFTISELTVLWRYRRRTS
jgi:hypothetical protein